MKTKEKLLPIDLVHLQEKARSAQHALNVYQNSERSDAYKKRKLKTALNVVDVIIRDIDYLMDTKDIGGYLVTDDE